MAERKHKFIKAAIKHPGVEIKRAKEHGISTHEQLERDSHSPDPTLRRRGTLGLTLQGMHHKSSPKAEKRYARKGVSRA